MGEALTPDICVIGAGSGGLTVAAAAAAFGVRVVLVERGRMGGDCLNYGCVPSKALIAAASHAAAIRQAPAFGVSAGEPIVDFSAVMAHVHGVIAEIAPFDSVERFSGLGVTVIAANARFLDERTLQAGPKTIRARRFVVATGSSPFVPEIAGLADLPFLTNETIFALRDLPRHLLIIGGGPIGLELGQAFRRLGSAVTIIDTGKAMAKEDPDLAAIVLARLRREGVDIREGAKVTRAAGTDGEVALTVETGGGETTIAGTHIWLAAGRSPNVEGLGLDAAGIEHGKRGIVVGRDLRTTNRRVYAVGDVAGGPQFTHVANHHAGLVARALLFRLPIRQMLDRLPRVTFTDPELAQVGLTEREARERGLPIDVVTFPYAENDRARTERRTEGLLKMIVGRRGRILGAGVAGEKAGEIANLFSLAIAKGLTMRNLAGFVSPYPTYSEIGKRAATAYYAPYARSAFVRMVVRLLSRLG